MKTAQELLKEMDAEIATKVAQSVEMNKGEIEKYVEASKVEAYNACVAKLKEAIVAQYAVARHYLEQLIEKEDATKVPETPVAIQNDDAQQSNQPTQEKPNEAPNAPVEGPKTI